MFRKLKVIVITVIIIFSIVQICMAENQKKSDLNQIYPGTKQVVVYTVRKGDNLNVIAFKYKRKFENVNNVITRIQVANDVTEIIYSGERLIIPLC